MPPPAPWSKFLAPAVLACATAVLGYKAYRSWQQRLEAGRARLADSDAPELRKQLVLTLPSLHRPSSMGHGHAVPYYGALGDESTHETKTLTPKLDVIPDAKDDAFDHTKILADGSEQITIRNTIWTVPKMSQPLGSKFGQRESKWQDPALATNLGLTHATLRLTGAGVKIAVLDTGFEVRHQALASLKKETRNFATNLVGAAGTDVPDISGHGTHVTSLIAQVAPDATYYLCKVFTDGKDEMGRDIHWAESEHIVRAIMWACHEGCKIINLSLGIAYDPNNTLLDDVIKFYANLLDVTFVVAAGNSQAELDEVIQFTTKLRKERKQIYLSRDLIGSPAVSKDAITVGACTFDCKRWASFSAFRAAVGAGKPELLAPGVDILGADHQSRTASAEVLTGGIYLDGTSMASPLVSGLAARLLQHGHGRFTREDVRTRLCSACKPLPGFDRPCQGAGPISFTSMAAQLLA